MYFKLNLNPGAKQEKIERVGADKFNVHVKEKAEHNLANKRALEVLAEHLNVPAANIRIMSGHHTPHKIVFIRH